MSDYKVVVTLPGYDIKTADPRQCAIHSDYPAFKAPLTTSPRFFNIASYAFGSNPPIGNTHMVTIAHNLGYLPVNIAYYSTVNTVGGSSNFSIFPWSWSDAPYFTAYAYATTTNFYIDFQRLSDGGGPFDSYDLTGLAFNFKYYIFVDQAT